MGPVSLDGAQSVLQYDNGGDCGQAYKNPAPPHICRLKEMCENFLLEQSIKTSDVLRVYQVAELAASEAVRVKYLNFILSSFPGLLEMAGEDNLQIVLGDELFAKTRKAQTEVEVKCLQLKGIKGRVLEPEAPEESSDQTETGTSNAGAAVTLPYARLKCGVCWPDHVNPKIRETYLSEEEFKQVFAMERTQFDELPGWKKDLKKKEMELF